MPSTPPPPPLRKLAPPAAVAAVAATEPTPAPAQDTAAAPAPAPKPVKAPKVSKPKPGAKVIAPKPKAKVEKPTKKAPPVKAKKSSPAPATENVVPKVKAITSRHYTAEQLEVAIICAELRSATFTKANTKNHGVEIRGLSPRLQVIINEKTGVACKKCFSKAEEINKIVAFVKKVPGELLPKKWARLVDAWEPLATN